MANTKTSSKPPDCHICDDEDTNLAKPLDSHACYDAEKQVNRCCRECWEHWFASQVETVPWYEIRCMFCPTDFGPAEMKKLGAHGDTLARYFKKKTTVNEFKCQNRCQGTDTIAQPFDREKDGRVFTCNKCNFQTCVDCDRPEHPEKTCEEVQAAVRADPAEAATSAKFLMCPQCRVTCKVAKGCGYTQCVGDGMIGGCGHRFCGHCLVSWVGEGSAYALGQIAHAVGCKYYNRLLDSDHNLSHRFPRSDEAQKEVDAKKERKKQTATAKKVGGNANKVTKATSARKTAREGRKSKTASSAWTLV
ncbi:hypothetical protein M409DRAFT_27196 [Zasmidium cellare ATCC 36951]|uniref:RING-type domain-containing protein n=1 Tax=Zasmidium cellare ATCC 36951 TaxID=1080233 RepID=A0A6A6C638_ZASCE|nr:uncharacterized protein M409DRAFT_27196 [Zasmidium cellare ATCC 36951]KAF2162574.1 hypothetical protein M409DRAFT_27196 [Zasmidium cellare ATCC 36951]